MSERREPIPLADDVWERLPQPVLPDRPALVAAYRGAWAIAIEKGLRPPASWNPANEWYVDACFAEGVFQWDSCFIALWLKYAQGAIPKLTNPLSCLDNFYAAQQPDGSIAREILPNGEFAQNKTADLDGPTTKVWYNHKAFTNPPLFSWAEWDYYLHTGDDSRLERVLPALAGYFDWYMNNRSRPEGFLWYDCWGSGMDNTPRGDAWCWVDYTCQAALDSEHLAQIALTVGNHQVAQAASTNYLLLKELVNEKMWNEMKLHYCDVDQDGFWTGTLNVGSYWALMANLSTPGRTAEMAKHLRLYRAFARTHMVPSLAAYEHGYKPGGGYWLGGVWPPTNYMVIRALERVGELELAHHIALNHVENVSRVYEETGTIWENYAPDAVTRGEKSKPDFCGWGALGPIAVLIESVIGIRVNAPLGEIIWTLRLEQNHGIRNLYVGDIIVDLFARWNRNKWYVTIISSGPVDVRLRCYAGTVNTVLATAGLVEAVVG